MPGPDKPTLLQIARLAKVSEATVSRVLNDAAGVADQTRQNVLDAYRALGGGMPRPIIGILVPDLSNQYFARLTVHLQALLLEQGYLPMVLSSAQPSGHLVPGINPIAVDLLLGMHAVGVVHGAVDRMEDSEVADLARSELPMVLFTQVRSSGNADFVDVDSSAGMSHAVRHLYDLGHEHIAFLEGIPETRTAIERLRSFLAAVDGMDRVDLVVDRIAGDYTFDAGIRAAKQIMSQNAGARPTAVVAANDEMAFGAIQAFGGAGMKLPDEVSVVGYDDTPFARWTHPSLASVAPDRSALAGTAVELLLTRIEQVRGTPAGKWPKPRFRTVDARYHSEERTSVGRALTR